MRHQEEPTGLVAVSTIALVLEKVDDAAASPRLGPYLLVDNTRVDAGQLYGGSATAGLEELSSDAVGAYPLVLLHAPEDGVDGCW